MKIPNLCIYIPPAQHKHSKVLFYPRYALPLFKRMWDPQMDNPDDLVRSIPFPKGTTEKFRFRDVPNVSAERSFWAEFFNKAIPGLFDTIYPGTTFEDAFEKLLEDMAQQKVVLVEKPIEPTIPAEIAEIGLDHALAMEFVKSGYKDLVSIARASLSELMEVDGLDAATAVQVRAYALDKSGEPEPVVIGNNAE